MISLRADGRVLESRWLGSSADQAPTLVFLHEGLGSVSQWRDFPERVAAATGMGALVFSRAGYGRSDPVPLPRPLHYMEHEGEVVLAQVLAAAGVRRALLVGHSDGASIALIYAAAHTSDQVDLIGMVLEAPHVFCEDLSVQSIRKAADDYEHGDLRERLRKHHGDNVDIAFWGWNRAWLDPAFRSWSLEHYLPRIRCPALVVQGREDPYGTERQVEAILDGVGDLGEKLILDSCGHAPHRDQPQKTLEAIVSAAARWTAEGTTKRRSR